MKLQGGEVDALNSAEQLIKYAAETPKTLPDTIVTPIANAWKASEENTWSPDIAAKFWTAYSSLCDLLKPVTLDTIAAGKPIKTRRWIFFGELEETTLPRRTANTYRLLLLLFLVTSIFFGFIATVSTKFSDDIQALIAKGDVLADDVAKSIGVLKTEIEKVAGSGADALTMSLDDPKIPAEVQSKISDLRQKLQALYFVIDQMHNRVKGIALITPFRVPQDYPTGPLSRLPNLSDGFDNVQGYYQTRRNVSESQQQVFILNGLYTAIVPMFLGAIGACTYVLRLISEQIKDVSFSTTSPVRHSVRVLLGALGGVVIGLGGIVTNAGLSAAALSFIAGYAVEPVFSTLDGIAEKFRRDT